MKIKKMTKKIRLTCFTIRMASYCSLFSHCFFSFPSVLISIYLSIYRSIYLSREREMSVMNLSFLTLAIFRIG